MIPTDLRKDAIELQKNTEWKDPGADGNHFLSLYYT
jgi:hypothetical protein